MALRSTRFAIAVRPTTDCALKEMVRARQVSPQLPLPGTSMMNGPGVGGQKIQTLSLDPDLDSNKDFVTSTCGLLGKLTLLNPKFCLLLRGGDATEATHLSEIYIYKTRCGETTNDGDGDDNT